MALGRRVLAWKQSVGISIGDQQARAPQCLEKCRFIEPRPTVCRPIPTAQANLYPVSIDSPLGRAAKAELA